MVCKIYNEKFNVNLKIVYDKSKPDGMPKKCLNINRAKKYGWKPKIIIMRLSK